MLSYQLMLELPQHLHLVQFWRRCLGSALSRTIVAHGWRAWIVGDPSAGHQTLGALAE